jgi:putative thioredoxin
VSLTAPVIDVGEATFEREVVERSHAVPVVVDFWAAWCGPCRVLGPILEKLAAEAGGAWVLAKVDVDANPGLAAAFGVQGIPAVHAFKDGRAVASFVGAQPEASVRAWLRQLGPSPAEAHVAEAARAEAAGELEEARAGYRRALTEDPGHAGAVSGLARVELALRARDADEATLRARFEAAPTDVDTAATLADALAARGAFDEAFEVMLAVIRATVGEPREQARRHLLSLLDVLTPDDPRALAARRALSRALF